LVSPLGTFGVPINRELARLQMICNTSYRNHVFLSRQSGVALFGMEATISQEGFNLGSKRGPQGKMAGLVSLIRKRELDMLIIS
jgi:hypothetical protein